MAGIMDPQPGMDVYDPCCGSAALLMKCRLVLDEKLRAAKKKSAAPLLRGQENEPSTLAMANMNLIMHDRGEIQIGDPFRKPKFRQGNRLQTLDRVVANPMWNQAEFKEKDYDACFRGIPARTRGGSSHPEISLPSTTLSPDIFPPAWRRLRQKPAPTW
jgi:type I restriction enzyme M protein